MNSLEWRNEQSRVAKSTDSSGERYSLKWRMSQMPNVTYLSDECYNLEWRMCPLSSKCNSLERRMYPLGSKGTVWSGEMNNLG